MNRLVALLTLWSVLKLHATVSMVTNRHIIKSIDLQPLRNLVKYCLTEPSVDHSSSLFPLAKEDEGKDYEYLYKAHVNAVTNLIRCDVISKNINNSSTTSSDDYINHAENLKNTISYPESYIDTLKVIDEILSSLDEYTHPAASLCKIIKKKESLPRYITLMRAGKVAVRDVVEIKRRTERVLSMLLLTLISTRISLDRDVQDDLIFFSKPLLEILPVQDRHIALIVLCKGIFAPNYRVSRDSGDVQLLCVPPSISLLASYREGMKAVGRSQFTVYGRLLYPVAVMCLRCHFKQNAAANFENKNVDVLFCRFLSTCMDMSQESKNDPTQLPCSIDDMLSSLHRWIHDSLAIHFINTNPSNVINAYPEEIRKNTIAMEILSTLSAFSEGKKKDREGYFLTMAEIGSYLDILMRRFTDTSSSVPELVRDAKILMAAVSSVRSLPESHRLKKSLQWKLGMGNAVVRTRDKGQAKPVGPASDLWPKNEVPSKFSRIAIRRVEDPFPAVGKSRSSTDDANDLLQKTSSMSIITSHLYDIIGDVLKVDSAAMGEEVLAEINDVFSTWRRPHLLLDYYRMHSSTPEISNVYRRFLKALFAVSDETVDDIRFGDKFNTCHLDRFPPKLIEAWRDGQINEGISIIRLPGYNDPQTLFMMGEDCNTCMSIRSKQKTTNRGLLAFLLHGCYRILGVKDESGVFLVRAVVQLLIDDATHSPLLYMHGPQGDLNCLLEVYDDAVELGRLLHLPVVYAVPPPSDEYILSEIEVLASAKDQKSYISDYSTLSPFVWLEGIKGQDEDKYFLDYPPDLIKTNLTCERITAGVRPTDSIEKSPLFGYWEMPSYIPTTIADSVVIEKVEPIKRKSESESSLFPNSNSFTRNINQRKRIPSINTSGISSVQARLANRQRVIAESQRSKRDQFSSTVDYNNLNLSEDITDDEL